MWQCLYLQRPYFTVFGMLLGISRWVVLCGPQPMTVQVWDSIKIVSIVVTIVVSLLFCEVCVSVWLREGQSFIHTRAEQRRRQPTGWSLNFGGTQTKSRWVVQWYEHVYLCFRLQPVSHNQKIMFKLMKITSCSLSHFTLKLTWPQLLSLSVLPIELEGGDHFSCFVFLQTASDKFGMPLNTFWS